MLYKYQGKDFEIKWDEDGRFSCRDLDIPLFANTPDEVKKMIRERTEKVEKLPSVPVIFKSAYGIDGFTFGQSKLQNSSTRNYNKEVVVTWKDERKNERKKLYISDVYLDTPENRALVESYMNLVEEKQKIREQMQHLQSKMKKAECVD